MAVNPDWNAEARVAFAYLVGTQCGGPTLQSVELDSIKTKAEIFWENVSHECRIALAGSLTKAARVVEEHSNFQTNFNSHTKKTTEFLELDTLRRQAANEENDDKIGRTPQAEDHLGTIQFYHDSMQQKTQELNLAIDLLGQWLGSLDPAIAHLQGFLQALSTAYTDYLAELGEMMTELRADLPHYSQLTDEVQNRRRRARRLGVNWVGGWAMATGGFATAEAWVNQDTTSGRVVDRMAVKVIQSTSEDVEEADKDFYADKNWFRNPNGTLKPMEVQMMETLKALAKSK